MPEDYTDQTSGDRITGADIVDGQLVLRRFDGTELTVAADGTSSAVAIVQVEADRGWTEDDASSILVDSDGGAPKTVTVPTGVAVGTWSLGTGIVFVGADGMTVIDTTGGQVALTILSVVASDFAVIAGVGGIPQGGPLESALNVAGMDLNNLADMSWQAGPYSYADSGGVSFSNDVTAGADTGNGTNGFVAQSADGTYFRLVPPNGGGPAIWVAV